MPSISAARSARSIFIRWTDWFGDPAEDRHRKLVFQLTYQ
jgi:hypothetical protein